MAGRLGVMFQVEMRPVPPGNWIYEGTRATYRGNVEVTFRYPDQYAVDLPVHIEPLSFTVPMVYSMHIPPAYVPRGQTPSSSAASASTQHSAFLGMMGPPAVAAAAPPAVPAPLAGAPVHAGIPPARLRIRLPAIRPGFHPPQYRFEHVPADPPAPAAPSPVFRAGGVQTRSSLRPSGPLPLPPRSEERAVPPALDVPGPSTRVPPKKRPRVDVVISSTEEEEEADPSEASS